MGHDLKSRLRNALTNAELSVSDCARQSGLKASFLYDILNGKSNNPSPMRLALLSPVLGISMADLLGVEAESIHAPANHTAPLSVALNKVLTVTKQANIGETVLQEPYYFRRRWIEQRLKANPDDLRLAFVPDDSMEPTLHQGDLLLVDISRTAPTPSGIFILFDGLGIITKRLEHVPHSNPAEVHLIPDNTHYTAYRSPAESLRILGRVVWFAREI